ncbi:MAG: motility associated factor glycosyltransferase family protein [Bacillota bacterium]
MKNLFELNLEALRENYLTLVKRIESLCETQTDSVVCEQTKSGMLNFKLNSEDSSFYLHSSYDPVKEAKNWISRIDLMGFDSIAVLGIGAGYHIEELITKYSNKNKIIIEPNIYVFIKLLQVKDIRHIIKAPNTLIVVSDDIENIAKVFLGLREEGQIDSVHFEELLSYKRIYGDWWNNFIKEFIKYSRLHEINTNTSVFFAKDWLTNFFESLKQFPESAYLDNYKCAFNKIPAIIVSAGPSLNKNIHLLKDLKNKAIIISAGSSVNILESRGITPHFMVGVDGGGGESRIFNSVKSEEIYFAYTSSVHYDGLKNYKGPKLYFKTNALEYGVWLDKEMGVDTRDMRSGASVSNLALDIAKMMGCDPVILIGQDLSYPNLECYADGAVLKDEQDKVIKKSIEKKDKMYILEKDIHGNLVHTIPSMISIKIYFEEFIKNNPDIKYLNGTEGGLPIKGVENKPLAQIINEYCDKEYDIDSILKRQYECDPISSENKRTKTIEFLHKIYEQSEKMKKRAIKRMDLILDILSNVNDTNNNRKWKEIDKLTDQIESFDVYKYFIEPLCKYFIQAVKNERERKIDSILDITGKKKFLYEGLLLQYTDIKDKVVIINDMSKKIINEMDREA